MFKLATEFPGFLLALCDSRGNKSSEGDHLVGKMCSAHQTCPIYHLLNQEDLLPNMEAQLTRGKPPHLFKFCSWFPNCVHSVITFISRKRFILARVTDNPEPI